MGLFKKKTQEAVDVSVNPLDSITTSQTIETQHKGGDVVGSIVNNNSSNISKMLDVTPDINQALLENLEPPKSVLLTILKAVFVFSVIAGGGIYIFFTSQTTSEMQFVNDIFKIKGTNAQLIALNEDVIEKQTELNSIVYMEIKGYLDDFIEHGSSFSQSYVILQGGNVKSSDKNNAISKMKVEREALEQILGHLNDKLSIEFEAGLAPVDEGNDNADSSVEKIEVPTKTLFTNALIKKLTVKYNKWGKSETIEGAQKMKTYGQIQDLVRNKRFRPLMVNLKLVEMTDEELYDFLTELSTVVTSDLSTIQQIKNNRVIWSDVMTEIEKRTKMSKAGIAFKGKSEMGTGIFYTNYDFNAGTREVTVTGSIKTDESNIFTQHIDLMEKLNESPMFSNADISAFTKTGGDGESFSSSVRFNLTLN